MLSGMNHHLATVPARLTVIFTSVAPMLTRLLSFRGAPIISRFADNRYRPIVVYTISKYKFLFLLPKVNKHESGSHLYAHTLTVCLAH